MNKGLKKKEMNKFNFMWFVPFIAVILLFVGLYWDPYDIDRKKMEWDKKGRVANDLPKIGDTVVIRHQDRIATIDTILMLTDGSVLYVIGEKAYLINELE